VITRGDIRWFRFGSPDKRRPVLVLGKPDVLPSLNQVPVIPLSTQDRGARLGGRIDGRRRPAQRMCP
jgi:mRNA-degrading endonuclease toxin of MazEF toxin-antitoxin module